MPRRPQAKKPTSKRPPQRKPFPKKSSHGNPPQKFKIPSRGEQVEGRQAVRELLLAGKRQVKKIFMAEDMDPAPILEDIQNLALEENVQIKKVSRDELDRLAKTDSPQGVMAKAEPIKFVQISDLAGNGTGKFLIVADGITDPSNMGAMCRNAECAGVTGLVLSGHRAVGITPSVLKSSAGAIEHLQIAQVASIPAAISDLKQHNIWTIGLDSAADQSIYDINLASENIALILGSEGKGISRLARERADILVSIPLQGNVFSLNVSSASAVACFEIQRQRLYPS